ncbi:MAG: PEGA domain-containing protein [Deltaproteobacteria bacterium]|nr:PEGA domain-containing protein [Deltaproteobacteria bacterium]
MPATRRPVRAILPRCLGVVALLGVLFASAANAKVSARDEREARRLFDQGVDLVNEGDLEGAIEKFWASYDRNPRAIVLFNIGAVQIELGNTEGALETLRRFLTEAGDDVDPDQLEQAQQVVRDLENQLTFLRVLVNEPGASITIDGRSAGTSPLLQPVHANPGVVEVRVRKDGFDEAVVMVPVPEARTTEITVTLVATQVAVVGGNGGQEGGQGGEGGEGGGEVPPVDGSVEWWQEWWFWTAVGAVVVGVSLGAGLGAWAAEDDRGSTAASWSVWGR